MDQQWSSFIKSSKEYLCEGENIYCRLQENREEGTDLIISPEHLGDMIWIAALAGAYIKTHDCERVCYVVKEVHLELVSRFPDISGIISLSDDEMGALRCFITVMQYWNREHIVFGHFRSFLMFKYPRLSVLRSADDFEKHETMHGIRQEILGIPGKADFGRMRPLDDGNDKVLKKRYEKAVLLMPAAQTVHAVPDDFWPRLAERYKKEGYLVYTNYNGFSYETVVEGTEPLSSSILELAKIGSYFAQVIGLRSGSCDLLAETETNLSILFYQKVKEKKVLLNRSELDPFGIYELVDREGMYCYQYYETMEEELIDALRKQCRPLETELV